MSKIGVLLHLLVGNLFAAFKLGAAAIVARVLATFGLTLVTFNGILPGIKQFMSSYINLLPASALNFVGSIGLDVAMSMILSALSVRLAWKVFVVPTSVAQGMGS